MAEDQNIKKQAVDEDYPIDHVPASARKTFFSVAAVLLGITFFAPTMSTGAQLASAFTFSKLMWIVLIGNLVLGIYVSMNCAIGAKTGLASVMLSRYTFGIGGAKWADVLLGGTQIGWYGYVCSYTGNLFATAFNAPRLEIWFTLAWGIIFGVTALWGYKAMEKVAYVAVPALLILVVCVPVLATQANGGMQAIVNAVPSAEMSVASALTAIVGTFASMGTQACNWSRFSKSVKAAFWSGFVAFMIGNTIMLLAGIFGGLAYGESDFIVVMHNTGLIFFALVVLTLNIWTTAHAGAYAWGIAGAEMFNKENKTPFLLGGLIIAIIIGVTGFYNRLFGFLNLLGVFIPPLGGAMLGDYFFVYKRRIPKLASVEFKTFRIAPAAAYVAGCIAAYITNNAGVGIPPLFGIILSAVLVPAFDALLRACKISDRHVIRENAEYIE